MIELKKVSKAFGEKKVINGLDLTIPDGQTMAIVGPSGGGKTTITKLRCPIAYCQRFLLMTVN